MHTDYLCTVKLRFWRATYAKSQAELDSYDDIMASKTAVDMQGHHDLKPALERHLDWRCRIPSSFISVLDDREMPSTGRLTRAAGRRNAMTI